MRETSPTTPAFPLVLDEDTNFSVVPGLTKREYFAAIALQGLLAGDVVKNLFPTEAACDALKYADALIEELNSDH